MSDPIAARVADRFLLAGEFNKDRVDEYMKMLKKVEEGKAEKWQATQLFRKMTGPDMNEIARRRRSGK